MLARLAQNARAHFIAEYSEPSLLDSLFSDPHGLVEARRKSGWPQTGLSVHYTKVSLEYALGFLRAGWRSAISQTLRQTRSDQRFTLCERAVAFAILSSPSQIARCLFRGESAEGLSPRLRRHLRRELLARRPRRPERIRKLWIEIDCNLYRPFLREDRHFRGAWIAITGLTRGKRLKIPLAGAGIAEFASRTDRADSRPNLHVEVGKRIVFSVRTQVPIRQHHGTEVAGVDKGYHTLITVSDGSPESAVGFGEGADRVIAAIAERASASQRQLRRIAAYERLIRNQKPSTATHIRRRNLGRRRATRASARDQAALRQQIDATLNGFFRSRPALSVLATEDLRFRGSRLSRSLNRRLGRWLKGYLQRRLAYKAELNGVELRVVNAAYTSQTCPRCWYVSAANRRGERFQCGDCGYTGSADAIAATNVLRRVSDPAITRFVPSAAVKLIVDERWRAARNGRAWGSNGEAPRTDERGNWSSGRAANNLLETTLEEVHTEALCPAAEDTIRGSGC